MSDDPDLLQRYLDGELGPEEELACRARLAASPVLRRQLSEIERVGSLLRAWADDAERRAGSLLEPTLARIHFVGLAPKSLR